MHVVRQAHEVNHGEYVVDDFTVFCRVTTATFPYLTVVHVTFELHNCPTHTEKFTSFLAREMAPYSSARGRRGSILDNTP
jgi:hypothetical protein